ESGLRRGIEAGALSPVKSGRDAIGRERRGIFLRGLTLTEKLPDHFFHRQFLHVDVHLGAFFEDLPAGLGDFCARHFYLDRHWRLLKHFAKRRKIAFGRLRKSKADDFVAGEAIDDGIERTVEKDFAVVDDNDAVAQFLDVLHVMARQHRHDLMFGIVEPEKFAHSFLTYDVETNRGLVEKKDAGLVEERGDQLHLHALA